MHLWRKRFTAKLIKSFRYVHQDVSCINYHRNNQNSIIGMFFKLRPENLSNFPKLKQPTMWKRQNLRSGHILKNLYFSLPFFFFFTSCLLYQKLLFLGMKIWVIIFSHFIGFLCPTSWNQNTASWENVFWVLNNQYANTYWLQFIDMTWYMLWLKDGSNIKCSIRKLK